MGAQPTGPANTSTDPPRPGNVHGGAGGCDPRQALYYQEGGSEKHLRDIAAMLRVSGDQIDTTYIDHWAAQLGLTREWQAVVERLRER